MLHSFFYFYYVKYSRKQYLALKVDVKTQTYCYYYRPMDVQESIQATPKSRAKKMKNTFEQRQSLEVKLREEEHNLRMEVFFTLM